MDACLRELDTMENVRRMYGGETRRALLEHYRRDLENAKKYGAEYVVFHAADAGIEQTLTGRGGYADREVIDGVCEFLNELMGGVTDGPALLLENLWESGLTMTEPELTARLMDGVEYKNKGIMLDTGHLMHTNTAASSGESISISRSRGHICGAWRKIRRCWLRTMRGGRTSCLSMCSGSTSISRSPVRACAR